MTQVKIGVLVGAHESGALTRFANTSLPFNTAALVKETLTDITRILQDYDKERVALLEQYMTKDEDGKPVFAEGGAVLFDDRAAFDAALGLVLHSEVNVRHIPFRKSQMLSSTAISPNDLMLLSWLIDCPDEDAEPVILNEEILQ